MIDSLVSSHENTNAEEESPRMIGGGFELSRPVIGRITPARRMGVPGGDAMRRSEPWAQLTPSGFESRDPANNQKDAP